MSTNIENSQSSPTVLIVEDDLVTRHFLARTLERCGYKIVETANGEDGLRQASSIIPDVILLDLGLPDIEGIHVIRRIREWSNVPVIILSLRGQEKDKVEALDAGADDYLTKPFGISELLARLRVALRHKSHVSSKSAIITVDGLSIDLAKRKVSINNNEVRLTPIEYNLLAALARNAGQVVAHRQLLQEVWGPQYTTETNYLRLYIKQLRDKLETNPSQPRYLLTDAGMGYRLNI
jgi:two-component system KDP operon response regulator KdpE